MKRWHIKGTINFEIEDFVTNSGTAIDALEDAIEDGLFDIAKFNYRIEKAEFEETDEW